MTHPVDTPRYRSELSQDAVQAEREKIAGWLDDCERDIAIKLRDVKSSETRAMLNKERGDLMLLSKLIRSGAYQAAPTPREKLKGEKG